MKKQLIPLAILAAAATTSGATATSPILSPEVKLARNIVLVYEIKARATRCGFEDIDIGYAEWQALIMDFSANYTSPKVDQSTLLSEVKSSEEFVDQAVAKDGCSERAASLHQYARDHLGWLLTEMDTVYRASTQGDADQPQ